MNKQALAVLSDEALLHEANKKKSTDFFDALIFGILIGIAVFSSIKNGVGLFTFLPLAYIPIAARNKAKYKEIEKLLVKRRLR